jgi:hypothetical protein
MLSFSDEELASIGELASALPCGVHSDFLQLLANRIAGCSEQERAPGLVSFSTVTRSRVRCRVPLESLLDGKLGEIDPRALVQDL